MPIFAASYLLPIASPPIEGGALAVENGRVVAVGPLAEIRASHPGPVTDFPGAAILPGMVNAHTHLELTNFPSWKVRKALDYHPRTYVDWVTQVVKIRRALTPEELQLSVKAGIRLCLEAGTTAIGEILTDGALAPLYAESPLRGTLFLEALGHDPAQCEQLMQRVSEDLRRPSGAFRPGISPHTPHTASAVIFQKAQQLSRELGVKKAVHLSESAEEASFMYDSSGAIADKLYTMAHWESYLPAPRKTTSTAYLQDLGFLDDATLAVHAVHVIPADAVLLKRAGVTVVLCPRSNERLAVGAAPHHLFRSLDIPLAVGTDSLASNDSLSLWDEIRFLRDLDPEQFSACELIRMATIGGARALGIDAEVGTLEAGKRADFQVVTTHAPHSGASLCGTLLENGRVAEVFLGGEALR
ncbi:amidohydrolase family protein [Geomesophilobacter sediminis]|uniref:Amidohydrolase family protein n=1 Tax=Geomesophilobacter sediminis TaxID=2798584 RepID=A0A8J7JIC5_9BACT|nr:amidohydrolase family protein [Geomesophilobacter sediminis]MBJ6724200.1 amidohydrolase family protein [Geomesophilobacter sediminis]